MWSELGYLWTNYQTALYVKRQLTSLGIKAKVERVGYEYAWCVINEQGEQLTASALVYDSDRIELSETLDFDKLTA